MRIGPFETQVTPELASLLQYVASVEEFYPDELIVADTPFLVYGDGRPCGDDPQQIQLVPIAQLHRDESILKLELLTIGRCLRGDFYTAGTVQRLESYAKVMYPVVREAINFNLRSFKANLLREHRLN